MTETTPSSLGNVITLTMSGLKTTWIELSGAAWRTYDDARVIPNRQCSRAA